jgi:hypothetical protein
MSTPEEKVSEANPIQTTRVSPPPPRWLASTHSLLQTNASSAAARGRAQRSQLLQEKADGKGETKSTMQKPMMTMDRKIPTLTPHQEKMMRERMSPFDDHGTAPTDTQLQRKIMGKIDEKDRLQNQWSEEPEGGKKNRLWEEIQKAEIAVEELEKKNNYWNRTGMGEQHPNISFQPYYINIDQLRPGENFKIALATREDAMSGDKPYVIRTAVGYGDPDFYINEDEEKMMRTMLPTQILSGSKTQSYQKLNQHSIDVDDLMPGQKYLIVMNQQATWGFECVSPGVQYEHESKKLLDREQKCNPMAVGKFRGMLKWNTFVERRDVDGVPARDLGLVGSRAGEAHQEYIDNTEDTIIPDIEAEIRKKKDVDKISQLKKNLDTIKGQLAEAKKIKPWTHYKIQKEKLVEGLKEGRLKRDLSHPDAHDRMHIAGFPLGTMGPCPYPDNIAPDTLVARFSCIQDIIESDLPHQSRISRWIRSMKPDYAYFPANGVRLTNGHTEWLFKFYPLKDEIQNIKDRKAAVLELLRTGEQEGPTSTTGCGNIPLMIQKDMSGKGMSGLGKGGVCKAPHQIAAMLTGFFGGRKKTRRKSHKKAHKKTRRKSHEKAHKKKRKKTRRRSHKKKRKTRKKKIKRK